MKQRTTQQALGLAALLTGAAIFTGFSQGSGDSQTLEERVARLEEKIQVKTNPNVEVRFGGRLMFDAIFADGDEELEAVVGEIDSGADVRRARFYAAGTLYEEVDFKLQFDWAISGTALKDAYMGINNPLGYLRVGHFYEAYSLAALVSSKHNTFMERAPSVNAFSPVRNDGIQLESTLADQRISWHNGVFWDADRNGEVIDEQRVSFTTRATALPVYEDDGSSLVHVGAAGSYRHINGPLRYLSRPSIFETQAFVDTRTTVVDPDTGEESNVNLDADEAWVYGLECAAVRDSFHIQAELSGSSADLSDGGTYQPMGWYAQAGYFLTGEVRPYKKKNGRFVNLKPNRNFGEGYGAWEVATRYSSVDLNDEGVSGGQLDEVTLGLNWYLNPNVRVMANYVYADLEDVGEAHYVGTRMQLVF